MGMMYGEKEERELPMYIWRKVRRRGGEGRGGEGHVYEELSGCSESPWK